ncbi:putative phosphoribulokinase/uridine kinase [Actinoplanes missouriensis 431]|uniref:Putative phosphoribulokinase/uridine kinase n=2 Tax=Actinoplanes missouriensis TaxID=1866 RepID=I0HC95_ACTM4|nr:putative phosphoribulokinase/uridine kinase [Actinoplanes missouriensis 431]
MPLRGVTSGEPLGGVTSGVPLRRVTSDVPLRPGLRPGPVEADHGRMRVVPVSFESLVEDLADRLASRESDTRIRVAVDGPDAADPARLADALADPLRVRGRPVVRVATSDFLRPASLRLEFGRTNPDSFYNGWFDEAGLTRELLVPAAPEGSGRVLTRLWDAGRDRSARQPYEELPACAIVLVSGPLLLGSGLPFDVTVHLELSAAALERRTAEDQRWTLPAFRRYADEVAPETFADVVVRVDDPRRPAIVLER